MLDKSQYARARGMRSLADNASQIFAPLVSGVPLAIIGLGGIMLIDVFIVPFIVTGDRAIWQAKWLRLCKDASSQPGRCYVVTHPPWAI